MMYSSYPCATRTLLSTAAGVQTNVVKVCRMPTHWCRATAILLIG